MNTTERNWSFVLIAIFAIAVILGVWYFMSNPNWDSNGNLTPAKKAATKIVDPYAGWKTYTSKTEIATFKYPGNWKVAPPKLGSNTPSADSTTVESPDGKVLVTWISEVDGLGGGCEATKLAADGGCPDVTVVDKASIAGASGLYVVSGITSLDGSSYYPWIAVQDSNGYLASSQKGLGYGVFMGRNNGKTLGVPSNETAVFNTTGFYLHGDQSYSLNDAKNLLKSDNMLTAKKILSSLTY